MIWKDKRFIIGRGLAFSETKEMQHLSKLAEEGWFLESPAFCGFGYKLCRGEKQELQYCIDYQKLTKEESIDYFDMFAAAGWNHVMTVGNVIHYFTAAPGTKPIYSDQTTLLEKYKQGKVNLGFTSIIFVFLTILMNLMGRLVEIEKVQQIFQGLFHIFLVVTIPVLMTYSAFLLKLWRLRQSNYHY